MIPDEEKPENPAPEEEPIYSEEDKLDKTVMDIDLERVRQTPSKGQTVVQPNEKEPLESVEELLRKKKGFFGRFKRIFQKN